MLHCQSIQVQTYSNDAPLDMFMYSFVCLGNKDKNIYGSS